MSWRSKFREVNTCFKLCLRSNEMCVFLVCLFLVFVCILWGHPWKCVAWEVSVLPWCQCSLDLPAQGFPEHGPEPSVQGLVGSQVDRGSFVQLHFSMRPLCPQAVEPTGDSLLPGPPAPWSSSSMSLSQRQQIKPTIGLGNTLIKSIKDWFGLQCPLKTWRQILIVCSVDGPFTLCALQASVTLLLSGGRVDGGTTSLPGGTTSQNTQIVALGLPFSCSASVVSYLTWIHFLHCKMKIIILKSFSSKVGMTPHWANACRNSFSIRCSGLCRRRWCSVGTQLQCIQVGPPDAGPPVASSEVER